jgi:hypothetical protein
LSERSGSGGDAADDHISRTPGGSTVPQAKEPRARAHFSALGRVSEQSFEGPAQDVS